MLISASTGILNAQNQAKPYVIIVEFTFDEAKANQAIDLLSEMQLKTLENEEGCLVYDVLVSEENPAKVFIYESYESEAAFKIHSNSSYFKEIVAKKLKPLIKQEKITKVSPLNFEGELSDEEV